MRREPTSTTSLKQKHDNRSAHTLSRVFSSDLLKKPYSRSLPRFSGSIADVVLVCFARSSKRKNASGRTCDGLRPVAMSSRTRIQRLSSVGLRMSDADCTNIAPEFRGKIAECSSLGLRALFAPEPTTGCSGSSESTELQYEGSRVSNMAIS